MCGAPRLVSVGNRGYDAAVYASLTASQAAGYVLGHYSTLSSDIGNAYRNSQVVVCDVAALLSRFALQHYITAFQEKNRNAADRLEQQMAFESFVLSLGPGALLEVDKAFQILDFSERDIGLIAWYAEFATSLDQAWLTQVAPDLLARAWRLDHEPRRRRLFLELMAKRDWITDHRETELGTPQWRNYARTFRKNAWPKMGLNKVPS